MGIHAQQPSMGCCSLNIYTGVLQQQEINDMQRKSIQQVNISEDNRRQIQLSNKGETNLERAIMRMSPLVLKWHFVYQYELMDVHILSLVQFTEQAWEWQHTNNNEHTTAWILASTYFSLKGPGSHGEMDGGLQSLGRKRSNSQDILYQTARNCSKDVKTT